jgi:hypothetical protein
MEEALEVAVYFGASAAALWGSGGAFVPRRACPERGLRSTWGGAESTAEVL